MNREEKYIETGYEDILVDVLENKKYNSILINGKFGIGKTTFLNKVIQRLNNKKESNFEIKKTTFLNEICNRICKNKEDTHVKKIEFKMYEEFIEANYIDFLYNSLGDRECCLKRWIIDNLVFLVLSILSFLLILIPFYFKNIRFAFDISNDLSKNVLNVAIVLALTYILFDFIKRKLEKRKVNKIEYIKKQLKDVDILVIDDLDRIYLERESEILKLIHFLNDINNKNNINFVLIMLGDRESFIGDTNKLNVLEKYYEYSFEITKEPIVEEVYNEFIRVLKQKFTLKLEELESDFWGRFMDNNSFIFIKDITPRCAFKIIKYINNLSDSEVKKIQRLYLNDFIFSLILYYSDYKMYKELFGILNNRIIKLQDIVLFSEENKKKYENKIKENIKNINLETNIELYIINNFFEGRHYNISGKERILENPKLYLINSIEANNYSDEEVKEKYKNWIYEEPSLINLTIVYQANRIFGYKINEKILLDRVEKIDDKYSKTYFNMLYNHPIDDKEFYNVNLKFLKLIYRKSTHDDLDVLDKIKELNYDELHYYNKIWYIIKEYYCGEDEQKNKLLQNFDELNKMLKVSLDLEYSAFIIELLKNDFNKVVNDKTLENFKQIFDEEKTKLDNTEFEIKDGLQERRERMKKLEEAINNYTKVTKK